MSLPKGPLPDDWEALLRFGKIGLTKTECRNPRFVFLLLMREKEFLKSMERFEVTLCRQEARRKAGGISRADVRLVVHVLMGSWREIRAAFQDFAGFVRQTCRRSNRGWPRINRLTKGWILGSPEHADVIKRVLKLVCALVAAYERRNFRIASPTIKDFAEDLQTLARAARKMSEKWLATDLKNTPAAQRITLPTESCAQLLAAILDDPLLLDNLGEQPGAPWDMEGPVALRVRLIESSFKERVARVSERCDDVIENLKDCFPDLGIATKHRPAKRSRDSIILLLKEAGASVNEIRDFAREVLEEELTGKAVHEAIARARRNGLSA